jgi:hypothetical protein
MRDAVIYGQEIGNDLHPSVVFTASEREVIIDPFALLPPYQPFQPGSCKSPLVDGTPTIQEEALQVLRMPFFPIYASEPAATF